MEYVLRTTKIRVIYDVYVKWVILRGRPTNTIQETAMPQIFKLYVLLHDGTTAVDANLAIAALRSLTLISVSALTSPISASVSAPR